MTETAVRIADLSVHYRLRQGWFQEPKTLRAVDGVNLDLFRGEILGLVGESGCGKTSLGRAVLRLLEPSSGKIEIGGIDLSELRGEALRKLRPQIQMVFQDPYASLDPRLSIYEALEEPLKAHLSLSALQRKEQIQNTLGLVGLPLSESKKYPHEFSGGQRQRIAIARALILKPKILIADEPVSSLDVSVQAQILNLLKNIQRELKLSVLFISHNLAVIKYISDRIAVMYLGKIVEIAPKDDLFAAPQHPYTQALLSAVPIPDPVQERARVRIRLAGEPPSAVNPPSGCAFHTRCPIAVEKCRVETPQLEPFQKSNWQVQCWEVKR